MSYDRLLQLTTDIGNGVCERFRIDGVVCPPKMRSVVFMQENIGSATISTLQHFVVFNV